MHFVQLKPGRYHGKEKEHGPGDQFEVSDTEFLAFGDKFISLGAVETTNDNTLLTASPSLTVNPATPETAVDPDANSSEPDSEDEPVNVRGINIEDVIAMIEAGDLDPATALASEEASGKARPSLVKQLKAMVGA